MTKWHLTLAALLALGGVASADGQHEDEPTVDGTPPPHEGAEGGARVPALETMPIASVHHRSLRGVAQDYLVLPAGGELTGQLKFITADPLLGGMPLKFTDLALLGLSGRWSLHPRIEVAASIDLLPKQPSYTDEKAWQSVGASVRTPIGHTMALEVAGSGGHLLDHTGLWASHAVALEWKKKILPEVFDFEVAGGLNGTYIADRPTSAFLGEVSLHGQWLFHEPTGHAGAWLGVAYALPVYKRGSDPTTLMPIDPQPRMDFHVGGVLAIEARWDLFAELVFVDRGDLAAPQTRLPILDGGFDQRQILFGVTRHLIRNRHDNLVLEMPSS
jgi:hypothetical protein